MCPIRMSVQLRHTICMAQFLTVLVFTNAYSYNCKKIVNIK